MNQARRLFAGEFLCVLALALYSAPSQAGGPVTGNAAAIPTSQGFMNFQNLGFLNPPAPSSAYSAPSGGQFYLPGGVSAGRNNGNTVERTHHRSGYGAGVYPYAAGYGFGGGPAFYITPGDYANQLEYTAPLPLDWNQGDDPQAPRPPATWIPPPRGDAATITLRVPPDADVWIEGVKMRQQGIVRQFVSPRLISGTTYSYEIRAAWQENGRVVNQKQDVSVRAGDRLSLTFVSGAGRRVEFVPAPAP